jgi:hypothetical protein
MTDIERKVLFDIIHAESGSDAGKGYFHVYEKETAASRKAVKMGYGNKLRYILSAITTLRGIRGGSKMINYWVEPDTLITYFDIKLETERLQVSFHTPAHVPGRGKLERFAGTGRKTVWTGERGGSIRACRIIGEYLNTH